MVFLKRIFWAAVACAAALALGAIADSRGERINSMWLVLAAACSYLLGYRFYAKFIAARVMALNDERATPSERLDNGHDYVPTNKWIVFGHHFAAIAGPGPLVGPVLAAQFGFLPGTLWIVAGAVFAGAIQDFIILFASMRRDAKSLGQMAREEIGKVGGLVALVTVLLIMIILLAVVGLVVVNALAGSPWGTFTIAATMPISIFMGLYLRYWRPGKVFECSAIGFILVVAAVLGGRFIANSSLAPVFTLSAMTIALLMILYGFLASVLPVWLLLAPRDYLSTFVKLGVIGMLAIGILAMRPELQMPSLTRFIDGTGPVFAGKIFPFCFITVACGAVSGFHALVASGTTPKMMARESHAISIGYGCMLLESFVAIMAMIAACVMDPGVYFAVNAPAGIVGRTAQAAVATISSWGFPVTTDQMASLARSVGEATLFSRTGGAPSLALGMAHIFAGGGGTQMMAFWYHFAIMFEAHHHRRGHARRTLHAAGPAQPRMETPEPHNPQSTDIDAWRHRDKPRDRRRVGFLPDSRRARSSRRHQLSLASLRHRKSTARRDCALGRHHHHPEDAWPEIHVDHLRPAHLARPRHLQRRMAKNLVAAACDWFSGPGKQARRCKRLGNCDLQRPP
jgi:carbon starvation protein